MDGELHNYCHMMERVSGDHPIKILQDVSDETVSVAKRAEMILKDNPSALKAFKEYEQGYMFVNDPPGIVTLLTLNAAAASILTSLITAFRLAGKHSSPYEHDFFRNEHARSNL